MHLSIENLKSQTEHFGTLTFYLNKFVEPLQQRLSEQNKAREALKKRWRKELRRVSEAVSNN